MRHIEQELLHHITELKKIDSRANISSASTNFHPAIKNIFEELQDEPIGYVSYEFLRHRLIASFINDSRDAELKIWLFIQTQSLSAIKNRIKEELFEYKLLKKTGRGLPPPELYSQPLIRSVYLSEDEDLIRIFMRYLPIPNASLFHGFDTPLVVKQKRTATRLSINHFLQEAPDHLSLKQIADTVKIQRMIRARKRMQEELGRISERKEWQIGREGAEKAIANGSMPYLPRCPEKELARRILMAAEKINLFSTVKHLTAEAYIKNVFDDALYGRRELLQSYLSFRPASLGDCDVEEGDGNVICFAPNEIDPKSMKPGTIELLFDLKKISKNNPCIFYKQRDFGFDYWKKRIIKINNLSLFFSHTERSERPGFSYLHFYDGQSKIGSYCLPNYSLISYDVKNIHKILALNFFKFLDSQDSELRTQIYQELSYLSDEDLVSCLENIGKQLTDTSEFNFFGAHQIDFSTLKSVSLYAYGQRKTFVLSLKKLMDAINKDDFDLLITANQALPKVFKSYRFLDYLLANTASEKGLYELQKMRAQCRAPFWIKPVNYPKAEPVIEKESVKCQALYEAPTHKSEPTITKIENHLLDELMSLSAQVDSLQTNQDVPPVFVEESLPFEMEIHQEQNDWLMVVMPEESIHNSPEPNPTAFINTLNLLLLGGFISVLGLATVVAFVALNTATLGTAGIVTVSLGSVALLTGIGFFSCGTVNLCQITGEPSLR